MFKNRQKNINKKDKEKKRKKRGRKVKRRKCNGQNKPSTIKHKIFKKIKI